jgi:hypothetical protein
MEALAGIIYLNPWSSRTAIWLVEQITDAKFTVEEDESGMTTVICDGIGYTSQPQPSTNDEGPGKVNEGHK